MSSNQVAVTVLLLSVLSGALSAADGFTWRELPRRTAEFYERDGAHGIPLHVDEPEAWSGKGSP